MAEHATTEFTTVEGNDYAEHEGTYAFVMKLAKIATASIILIVIALAMGGVHGSWGFTALGVVLAIASGVVGATTSEKGTIVPVIVSGIATVGLWAVFG